MKFFFAVVVASLAVASANIHHSLSEKEIETQFTSFIKKFQKKYTHDEFFNRYDTFKANLDIIHKHNASGAKYTLGVNQFADLSLEEFKAARLGFKNVDHGVYRKRNEKQIVKSEANPKSVDWRTEGIITPVKDQGQCGSCWAFSTTGSIEAAWVQAGNNLVSLSEQQLVDCSTAQGNQGCNGGLMDYAFQYVIKNKGITTEAAYPYKGTGPNTCQKGKKVAATISDFTDVPASDEDALETAVAQQPVSVAIEADQSAFQLYSGGVFTAKCGRQLDHGVLAVGYGTQGGTDYWIVKNSWGASWGESGYIRLEKGIDQCGIADQASYPTI